MKIKTKLICYRVDKNTNAEKNNITIVVFDYNCNNNI